jgi:hypothetical protein
VASFLTAIQSIVNHYDAVLDGGSGHANRMNAMGVALEDFIKDAFADSFGLNDVQRRAKHQLVFSYLGNQNNPPDVMLKGSDAIEVKKLESTGNAIALNSSYPKAKLFANSPMITAACRTCESWQEKDLIYAIGTIENKTQLRHLWLVYGDCFVADASVYEKIKTVISSGVRSISDIEFSETKELGKVKKVDPLGITDLRIRGMWSIQNPSKVFANISSVDAKADFQLTCLVSEQKFQSFSIEERNAINDLQSNFFSIQDVHIRNPNNPLNDFNAKLISFKVLS